jgi:hypothetical protein
MQRKFLLLLVLLSIFTAGWAAAGYQPTISRPETEKATTVTDPLLTQFSDYRKWTLVNPVPQLMKPAAVLDCARVPGRKEGSPHLNKYISVYVNEIGRAAMMTQRTPRFPTGSMIVKEKLSSQASTTPELLTAMVKREQGFNPESGDWEYVVLNGSAEEITERGKLRSCQDCHHVYQRSDFVTRTYLPAEIRQGLK